MDLRSSSGDTFGNALPNPNFSDSVNVPLVPTDEPFRSAAEHAVPEVSKKVGTWGTSLNLIKCIVGAGCFILPSAFKSAGLWAGLISLLILAWLSVYTMKLLAQSELDFVKDNPQRTERPSYVTIGRATHGPVIGAAIWIGIVCTILGVCGVYLDIISGEISDMIDKKLTQKEMMLILTPPLIFLSWIRTMKHFAFTSLLGDIAVTMGIVTVLIYGAVKSNDIESPSTFSFIHIHTYSKFFGQCVFLFAVHAVILPLSQSMEEPTKFPTVANWSFVAVTFINATFGFVGYVLYGNGVKGLVIDNVKGPVGTVVKLLLCVDLFFTVPIVLTAPRQLMEKAIFARIGNKHRYWKENIIRTCTVLVFLGLALAVPSVGDLANLVGCVVGPFLGFIMPTLFYLHYHRDRITRLSKGLHYLIVVFGSFACVYTTIKQIESMV